MLSAGFTIICTNSKDVLEEATLLFQIQPVFFHHC